ncbi:prolipoprotein diacylglyceryl transferase [Wukongibacter baidiensis]|uniref:prolipoprotein diacylglyceryl transferase n=1 Tax=Wukongibacter baidiensis TaxID=1723361 RepID=UPI003D7F2D57
MVELFRIGHVSIYLFGITIALGMLTGMAIMIKEAKRKGMDIDKLTDLAVYTIIASLIGARLYYVLAFNLEYYLANPKAIISIRDGGLSIQGALILGIGFAFWYTKKKRISFWEVADVFAPGIIIGQAIGRIGCDVFGVPMEKPYPWGVVANSQLLHPAQLYEALLDLLLFTYLWRSRSKVRYNGELFIKYIIGFSIIRGIVEFFRTNPIVYGPFTIAHITSLVIIAIALLIHKSIKKRKIIPYESESSNTLKVSVMHYIIIALFAGVSTWFYYYIH